MKIILGLFLCLFISPLIIKNTMNINSPDKYSDLLIADVSKYKKIRIAVKRNDENKEKSIDGFQITAVENNDEAEIYRNPVGDSVVIDLPPDKIKIKVIGKGNFSAYVWAQ